MFENWLNPGWSEAFAWAWLHSWWQGALAMCLYAGMARALTKSRARYALACASLLLALALPAATFYKLKNAPPARKHALSNNQLPPEEYNPQMDLLAGGEAAPSRAPSPNPTARERQTDSLRQQAAERFAAWSPYLALLWLAGVLVLTARTLGGWWAVRRLCRSAAPVSRYWRQRLEVLAKRVALSRAVRLSESALVQVPTVIGWLRPVILVPVGVLAGLPPNQLEALLAHELAHLRRHDFLVNLFQIAVETLLFYHPAAWWLSRQIRIEREHVCDDIAVAALGDPFVYAHALTNLELYRRQTDWTSVALAANGGNLMQRIHRLIKPNTTPRTTWAGGLLFVLIVGTLLAGSFVFSKLTAQATGRALQSKRKVAVGLVVVPFVSRPKPAGEDPAYAMRLLINNLKNEQIPAVGFVQGARVDDEWSRQLLRDWMAAGFELGTGNFSHSWFYGKPYDDYVADLAKNEEALRPLLAERGKNIRYFSYPMLNTGPDAATKARFEGLLQERGYRVAKFTIDNDDWIFGKAYQESAPADRPKIVAEYLPYMARMFDFYEGMSQELFGREIPQILLVTTNRMTAEQLPALAKMLRERGYEFVTIEEALQDEAYNSPETYTGQTGISWLQRWNITRGQAWREEPKPAGYMEQFQMHKGQGNLKAPPPPPPAPPAELRRKAPRPPAPARGPEPPRPSQPVVPAEVTATRAPTAPAPAQEPTYPRQAAPPANAYPGEVPPSPQPATSPRAPKSFPRVPAVESLPAPASFPRVPAITPQPAKPVTLPRKPAPPPPPARPEN